MGTALSVQSVVQHINNEIEQNITQESNGKAEIDCIIKIKNIKIGYSKNCSISLVNRCYAETEIQLESFSAAIGTFINNLNADQKQEAASWFTTTVGIASTVNNISDKASQYIEQSCNTESKVNEIIESDNLIIERCEADEPLIMKFYNVGNAKSHCGMKVLTDLEAKYSTTSIVKQSQGLDWSKLMWPIMIIVVILAIIYAILTYISKKVPSSEDKINIERIKKNTYATRIYELNQMRNNYL